MSYERKPSNDSGYLLWQISNLWQKRMNDIFFQYDITHVQYLLLATIVWMNKHDIEITQNNLAEHAQSHKMMTSKVIRILEKKGYVKRRKNKRDSRYNLIDLTTSGLEKFNELKNIFKKEDTLFFNRIERNRFSIKQIFVDIIKENRGYSPSI